MNILHMLGIGSNKLVEGGQSVSGQVTEVKRCWWLKVNTKPVRTHAMDGAFFPHIIAYRYTVDGQTYEGQRMISPYARVPHVNDAICVYYDAARPSHSTINL